jgi:DNA-binding transcriptional regulator YiaG
MKQKFQNRTSMTEFRRLRKTKGYTQDELARIFKTTIRTISRWETGERAVPYTALIALKGLPKKTPKSKGRL